MVIIRGRTACSRADFSWAHQRRVYFTLIVNWKAEAEIDPATATAFTSAASQAMSLVPGALSA